MSRELDVKGAPATRPAWLETTWGRPCRASSLPGTHVPESNEKLGAKLLRAQAIWVLDDRPEIRPPLTDLRQMSASDGDLSRQLAREVDQEH